MNSEIIVTNWYNPKLNDLEPRQFSSRRRLLEEMIEQDTAAAHSNTLLSDILADDYDGDRDAMAADIGTGAFDDYEVVNDYWPWHHHRIDPDDWREDAREVPTKGR